MVSAHLENVRDGEDADKLCASTPLNIYGRHILRPDSCALRVSPVISLKRNCRICVFLGTVHVWPLVH